MASCVRLAVAACALILTIPAVAGASKTENAVLAEINQYRASHGVKPVRHSRSLDRSAGRFANRILRTDRLRHDRRIRANSRFRTAGENIAFQPGNRRRAGRVLAMWVRSAAHRRVLLNPRFTWGGVGRKYGRLGSRRSTVWVLHLGRK